MADIPNPLGPTGAVPPPKKETGKVQPKKETVRINLPPKPTAAPTIKLPTLPPGGPGGMPIPAHAPAPMAPAAAAPALKSSASAAPAPAAAKPGAPSAQRPTGGSRPAAPSGAPTMKTVDKALILTSCVASLAAVGCVTWVFLTLKNIVEAYQS
jgi:hypothetical protein